LEVNMPGNEYVLYSTKCPKCRALEMLLNKHNINYITITDEQTMIDLGMQSAPQLELPDGTRLGFASAMQYLNTMGDK
jgi:predicted DCC family thiol-disulfide oxidoreductase YuxK